MRFLATLIAPTLCAKKRSARKARYRKKSFRSSQAKRKIAAMMIRSPLFICASPKATALRKNAPLRISRWRGFGSIATTTTSAAKIGSRACLKLDPQNKEAVRALVDLLGRQNRGPEMAPLLKQLEPGAEVSAEERAAWALQSGRSALAAGDETTALEHFTAAAAQSSEALWAAFDLLVKRDEKADAVALAEQRLQQSNMGPGDLSRLRTAADFARVIKSPAEATLLEKLADLAAADAKTYERLAELVERAQWRQNGRATLAHASRRRACKAASAPSAFIDIAKDAFVKSGDLDIMPVQAPRREAFNLAPERARSTRDAARGVPRAWKASSACSWWASA